MGQEPHWFRSHQDRRPKKSTITHAKIIIKGKIIRAKILKKNCISKIIIKCMGKIIKKGKAVRQSGILYLDTGDSARKIPLVRVNSRVISLIINFPALINPKLRP